MKGENDVVKKGLLLLVIVQWEMIDLRGNAVLMEMLR